MNFCCAAGTCARCVAVWQRQQRIRWERNAKFFLGVAMAVEATQPHPLSGLFSIPHVSVSGKVEIDVHPGEPHPGGPVKSAYAMCANPNCLARRPSGAECCESCQASRDRRHAWAKARLHTACNCSCYDGHHVSCPEYVDILKVSREEYWARRKAWWGQ